MSHIYGAFGDSAAIGQHARSAYTGACVTPGTGAYALGRRLYSPVLRRFLNPDPVSPFESGGLNRYTYCGGDPVNRTDPTGNTWRTWLTSILGLSTPPVRTAGGSSGLPHSPAGDTTADAIASPTVLASAVSAIADTTAPLVTLGSIASRTAQAPKAGGVFGWTSLGSGHAPGDLTSLDNIPLGGVAVEQRQDYRRTTHTFSNGDHQIDNYEGRAALLEQVPTRLTAAPSDVLTRWWSIPNAKGGTNYVADSAIYLKEVFPLVHSIGASAGSRRIILLVGAHGSSDGINWANGRRLYVDRRFYEAANTIQSIHAAEARRRDDDVEVRNIGDMSNIDFVRVSNGNAIVVHGYCYGVADRELMFEHNVRRTATYRL
ncbi:RHS repeat-associated protein [Luteibacter jiangsuensis]|uniref:RHS repeat-associated protein n=1 Tax=Luteibacter jiangsuensis TaxID=637577 RepID=A0ABT9T1M7_9GAMM|nr:RHS repeat-associated core domain-containing protein [Luteibacter jiangsuensis]MDQ0011178.1 RHS repeat-associated protein [Luteibacter jiangsuensis]